jgi:hypothetical protein
VSTAIYPRPSLLVAQLATHSAIGAKVIKLHSGITVKLPSQPPPTGIPNGRHYSMTTDDQGFSFTVVDIPPGGQFDIDQGIRTLATSSGAAVTSSQQPPTTESRSARTLCLHTGTAGRHNPSAE